MAESGQPPLPAPAWQAITRPPNKDSQLAGHRPPLPLRRLHGPAHRNPQGGGARPADAGIDSPTLTRTADPTSTTPRDVTLPGPAQAAGARSHIARVSTDAVPRPRDGGDRRLEEARWATVLAYIQAQYPPSVQASALRAAVRGSAAVDGRVGRGGLLKATAGATSGPACLYFRLLSADGGGLEGGGEPEGCLGGGCIFDPSPEPL
jgi:hypothetical protein